MSYDRKNSWILGLQEKNSPLTLRSHTTGEFHGSHTESYVNQKINEHALNILDSVQKFDL